MINSDRNLKFYWTVYKATDQLKKVTENEEARVKY